MPIGLARRCVYCRAAKPRAGSATLCGLPANRSFLDRRLVRRLVRRSFSEGGSLLGLRSLGEVGGVGGSLGEGGGVGGSLGEGGSEV